MQVNADQLPSKNRILKRQMKPQIYFAQLPFFRRSLPPNTALEISAAFFKKPLFALDNDSGLATISVRGGAAR